jgi:hypothetical protein
VSSHTLQRSCVPTSHRAQITTHTTTTGCAIFISFVFAFTLTVTITITLLTHYTEMESEAGCTQDAE